MLSRVLLLIALPVSFVSTAAAQVDLCDYWPLAAGNRWVQATVQGPTIMVEVTAERTAGEVTYWEVHTQGEDDPTPSLDYYAYLNGFLYRTGDEDDMALLPALPVSLEPLYPETFTPGVPVTRPDGVVLTPAQNSLSGFVTSESLPLDPADFDHGNQADVVGFFVDGGLESPLFARNLGIMFSSEIVASPGCGFLGGEEEVEGEGEGEPEPLCAGNLVRNGGFETGSSTADWLLRPVSGAVGLYQNAAQAGSGAWYVSFNGQSGAASTASIEQTINLPAFSAGTLKFKLAKPRRSTNSTDKLTIYLGDQTVATYTEFISIPQGTYQQGAINLPARSSAGNAVLKFEATGTGVPGATTWLLDEVCLTVTPVTGGPCVLSEVTLTEPGASSRLYRSSTLSASALALEADTNCPANTSRIRFILEAPSGEVLLNEASVAPYTASVPWSLLQAGSNTLRMEATGTTGATGTAGTVTSRSTITVQTVDASVDADGNGLPDRPFTALSNAADRWLTQNGLSSSGAQALTYVAPLRPSAGSQNVKSHVVVLRSPIHPEQVVTITVPGTLLANELGILVARIAPDLNSLLGRDVAGALASQPSGGFNGAAQYLQISLLVSNSGGAAFEEISSTRLAELPLQIRFDGLPLLADSSYTLETHRTRATEDAAGRLQIRAVNDAWRSVSTAVVDNSTGSASASLTTLGVVAPFEELTGAEERTPLSILLLILGSLGILGLAEGGGPCFIATAAYGTPMAAEIDTLRAFRDTWLLTNPAGTAFVDFYYRVSPALADQVAQHPVLGVAVRALLLPVLLVTNLMMTLPGWVWAALALAVVTIRQRRRARAR